MEVGLPLQIAPSGGDAPLDDDNELFSRTQLKLSPFCEILDCNSQNMVAMETSSTSLYCSDTAQHIIKLGDLVEW